MDKINEVARQPLCFPSRSQSWKLCIHLLFRFPDSLLLPARIWTYKPAFHGSLQTMKSLTLTLKGLAGKTRLLTQECIHTVDGRVLPWPLQSLLSLELRSCVRQNWSVQPVLPHLLCQDIFPQHNVYMFFGYTYYMYTYVYTFTYECHLIHTHINLCRTCHSHYHLFSSLLLIPLYQVTKAWHCISSLKCVVAGVFLATWNGSKPSLSLSVTSPPPASRQDWFTRAARCRKIQQESSMAWPQLLKKHLLICTKRYKLHAMPESSRGCNEFHHSNPETGGSARQVLTRLCFLSFWSGKPVWFFQAYLLRYLGVLAILTFFIFI